ncbi:hypothetical protein FQA39_LY07005 [Lamprigera yunnana]|nr:hypothetical protein FQA39_LY07005 [Lamprigera yunnana]
MVEFENFEYLPILDVTLRKEDPQELNDFLRRVLDKKDLFKKIRETAKGLLNVNVQYTTREEPHPKFSKSGAMPEIIINRRGGLYDRKPINDVYPHDLNYMDNYNQIENRISRDLTPNSYNDKYNFDRMYVEINPKSEVGVNNVPGNKYGEARENIHFLSKRELEPSDRPIKEKYIPKTKILHNTQFRDNADYFDESIDNSKIYNNKNVLATLDNTNEKNILNVNNKETYDPPESEETVQNVIYDSIDDSPQERQNTLLDVDEPTSALEQYELSTRPYKLFTETKAIIITTSEEQLQNPFSEQSNYQFAPKESVDLIHGRNLKASVKKISRIYIKQKEDPIDTSNEDLQKQSKFRIYRSEHKDSISATATSRSTSAPNYRSRNLLFRDYNDDVGDYGQIDDNQNHKKGEKVNSQHDAPSNAEGWDDTFLLHVYNDNVGDNKQTDDNPNNKKEEKMKLVRLPTQHGISSDAQGWEDDYDEKEDSMGPVKIEYSKKKNVQNHFDNRFLNVKNAANDYNSGNDEYQKTQYSADSKSNKKSNETYIKVIFCEGGVPKEDAKMDRFTYTRNITNGVNKPLNFDCKNLCGKINMDGDVQIKCCECNCLTLDKDKLNNCKKVCQQNIKKTVVDEDKDKHLNNIYYNPFGHYNGKRIKVEVPRENTVSTNSLLSNVFTHFHTKHDQNKFHPPGENGFEEINMHKNIQKNYNVRKKHQTNNHNKSGKNEKCDKNNTQNEDIDKNMFDEKSDDTEVLPLPLKTLNNDYVITKSTANENNWKTLVKSSMKSGHQKIKSKEQNLQSNILYYPKDLKIVTNPQSFNIRRSKRKTPQEIFSGFISNDSKQKGKEQKLLHSQSLLQDNIESSKALAEIEQRDKNNVGGKRVARDDKLESIKEWINPKSNKQKSNQGDENKEPKVENEAETAQFHEALYGQLAASIVDKVFDELANHKDLSTRFMHGLSNKQNKDELKELESFRDSENGNNIQHTEKMLHEMMILINNIILDQVQRRTCKRISPKLKLFLKSITTIKSKQSVNEDAKGDDEGVPIQPVKSNKARQSPKYEPETSFLFQKNQMESAVERIGANIVEEMEMIKGLLQEYQSLQPRCKQKAQAVELYLKQHLTMLKQMSTTISNLKNPKRRFRYAPSVSNNLYKPFDIPEKHSSGYDPNNFFHERLKSLKQKHKGTEQLNNLKPSYRSDDKVRNDKNPAMSPKFQKLLLNANYLKGKRKEDDKKSFDKTNQYNTKVANSNASS